MTRATEPVEHDHVEGTARAIDRAIASWRTEAIHAIECSNRIVELLTDQARRDDPTEDLLLLVDYAGAAVLETTANRGRNPILLQELLREQLDWLAHYEELESEFRELYARLLRDSFAGDTAELIDLCGAGFAHQRLFLAPTGWAQDLLRLARSIPVIAALEAAVHPRNSNRLGRFGIVNETTTIVLDWLAHLAADPEGRHAEPAIDALLRLAAFDELCPYVVLRLPLHRLDSDRRQTLYELTEHRADLLFGDNPIMVPAGPWQVVGSRLVDSAAHMIADANSVGLLD